MMEEKRPIKIDVHTEFRELLEDIQTERIRKGKENVRNKMSKWKITKAITNMIKANPKLLEMLCEVETKNDKP